MATVEAAKATTTKSSSDVQGLQDENKRLHLLLETLKAKLLKAELAVKDGKPASELKDMKEAILYVTPLGDPKNASQTKDMKDFYENLAASLAVPNTKSPSKAAKSSSTAVEIKTTAKESTQEVKTGGTGEDNVTKHSDELADEFGDEEGGASTKAKDNNNNTASSSDAKALSSEDGQTVVVTSNEEPEDDSHRSNKKPPQQVCVVDLKNAEWWTLVDKEDAQEDENMYVDVKPDGTSADLNPDEDNHDDEFDDGPEEAFGEQYEVVKDDELASALSDYVSLSMKMYPEAKQVAPEEMKKMLDKAFGELKPKGAVARLWGWGQFAYSAFGWGQWVFKMYKEPAVVKLVATGVWNAAQWAIVFVL